MKLEYPLLYRRSESRSAFDQLCAPIILRDEDIARTAMRDQRVVRVTKRRLHRLHVTDLRLIAPCRRGIDLRPDACGADDRLQQGAGDRPHSSRCRKQIRQIGTFTAEAAGQNERRKVLRARFVDASARRDEVRFGLANVGAPRQQSAGKPEGTSSPIAVVARSLPRATFGV